ncbi:MAG: histidine kinase [Acidobacteria bacterium]|nr:histidine kinase [Acidobacteriota bacterium]
MIGPETHRRAYWACQALFWSAYFLDYLLYGVAGNIPLAATFWAAFPNAVFGFGATHLYRAWIQARGWTRQPLPRLLPRVVLSVAFLAALWNLFESLLLSISGWWSLLDYFRSGFKPNKSLPVFYLDFCMDLLYLSLWSAVYFGYHYLRDYHEERFEKLRVQADLKEAELMALRSQLNPHFLFNCLNSIRSLITESPERAKEMVTLLSGTLRYALLSASKPTVPLEDEMRIVSDYLSIEAARFEERLEVRLAIDPRTLPLPVPPLIVQTLAENAVKHGISRLERGGRVDIRSGLEGETLVVEVLNDGKPSDPSPGGGTGLSNARRRLESLFGGSARIDLKGEGGDRVLARLVIPLAKEDE